VPHTLSTATTAALRVVGYDVRIARQERGWTIQELADRAGVNERTVRAVERGAPTTGVGTVFELAWLVGLELLGRDDRELPDLVAQRKQRLTLAPKRVHTSARPSRQAF
jgi:transcriptional regulator with XRE-family HTH domain